MSRGRSTSPRNLNRVRDSSDEEMRSVSPPARDLNNNNLKVVIITNLTRNVVESHLRTIFSFYGEIRKVDFPVYGKSGQNRGKAALEYFEPAAAEKAVSHMNKGQLDGSTLSVELSDTILRDRSRSRSPRQPPPPPPPPRARNGRGYRRSISRSLSPYPRRRGPPPRDRDYRDRDRDPRDRDGRYPSRYSPPPPPRRSAYPPRRRGPPGRDTYRPRSDSRSRSPVRRGAPRFAAGRRSPSYERGGTGYRRRSRSRSPYSLASSRSRTRSRSRSRSYSYSSRSRSSRSRTRSPRSSRSRSREDIRDSRSRSRSPL